MRRTLLLLPFICASFPLAAQDGAPPPAAAADAPAGLSQAAFDPKDYLAQTRWTDGCYGVSLAEPKDMKRVNFPEPHSPARWTAKNGSVDCDITASFLLPSGHSEDKAAPELSLKNTAAFLLSNLTAGQGAAYPLPQFSRDLIADRHAVTVAYYLMKPLTRRNDAPADAFLTGAAIVRVNPRCHFMLRLTCRIPAGTQGELPFLMEAQRRLEAMAGSIRLVPEATMTALREAQLARGADVLARLPASAALPLPPECLLRIVQDDRDIGWMKLEARQQDKAWYAAHPPAGNSVDGLRTPGLKVTVRAHTQDAGAQADVLQSFFKSGDSLYESWQRTSTFRATAQEQALTASEMGSVLPAQGKRPPMLQVEWAGTTPPGLAHFFRANPQWRQKQAERAVNTPGTAPKTELPRGAIAATADAGKSLGGRLEKEYWEMARTSLSQAHAWLLPWLLPKDIPQSYAFAFYSPEAKHPGFCLFKVAPAADGSRAVAFRPALDQPEQVFQFGPDGQLRRIDLPDGTSLVPATAEKLAEIWKLAPKAK